MNDYITSTSGKKVRIWGTFAPSVGGTVNKSVSIQHWANFEANPLYDFVNNGYEVLNSGDYIYTVGKWSEWYGVSDQSKLTCVDAMTGLTWRKA